MLTMEYIFALQQSIVFTIADAATKLGDPRPAVNASSDEMVPKGRAMRSRNKRPASTLDSDDDDDVNITSVLTQNVPKAAAAGIPENGIPPQLVKPKKKRGRPPGAKNTAKSSKAS